MRRLGLGLLVGICAWSLAGPAAARPVPPAPDAPVVASLPGGATLVAFDHGADLCFGLRRGGSATCDAPPHGYLDPRVEASGVNGEQVVYGVTTSDATSVEVLAAGASATGPVSGGAYAGRFAGQVQFFLVAVNGAPYRVLLRDSQGRVVAASDLLPAPTVGRPVGIAHGRTGGVGWRASAYQTTHLQPSPLDRGRTERLTCIRILFANERPIDEGCSDPALTPAP